MKYLWGLTFTIVMLWSGINPKDQFTWLLEVVPAMIAAVALVLTFNTFRLTPLLYFLILLHSIILMVGGHFTYAEVPLFDELFGATRNNYDKLGHFAQGFVPALVAREIIIRKSIINGGKWRNFFIITFCLAFSAFYELVEWWVALASGDDAQAFLGTQGYVWDTQSDMGFALLGAVLALLVGAKLHDRQLAILNISMTK